MMLESAATADSFTIRYTTQPTDPMMVGVAAMIIGTSGLLMFAMSAPSGLFVTLVEIGLAGLMLFGIAVLGSGKRQAPPKTVITRFTRAQQVRIEVRQGVEPPEATELAFSDIVDVRVLSSAGAGSSTERMMLTPRQGAPIEIACLSQRGISARQIHALATELRAWTGLPGPGVSPLGTVVHWASGWGQS